MLVDGIVFAGFHLWVPFRAAAIVRRFALGAEWRPRTVRIMHRGFVDPNDIAVPYRGGIAEEGPVLIEGNGKPGLYAAQRATRTGVGETRFGALVAHHLGAAD